MLDVRRWIFDAVAPRAQASPWSDQRMLTRSDTTKRLECAGLPALLGLSRTESGSKLPHSKRFAPHTGLLALTMLFAFVCAPGFAAGKATPEEEGLALAMDLRSQRPVEDLAASGVLKMRHAAGRRWEAVPVGMRVSTNGESWSVCYGTPGTAQRPAEALVVMHSIGRSNEYRYAKAAAPAQPVPPPASLQPDETAAPFAGSDFWLCDLGLEFFHWPGQRLVKTEMRKGRACRVLESSPANPQRSAYARVLSWIDIETGGLLRAEAFDQKRKLLKVFSVRLLEKINGRWELKEIEICNAQTDARTRLEFDLQVEAP